MIHRNVLFVGLAAAAAVLAGCAAQYRNPGSCVAEMRSRLDETSQASLKITSRAVSYRGQRVVIEGHFDHARVPVAASAASAASAAVAAPASAAAASAPVAGSAPSAGVAHVDAASDAIAQPRPTTPVGALVARFSRPRKTTPVAAECTFDESGLKSFRWLAPAELAKTTPAPAHTE